MIPFNKPYLTGKEAIFVNEAIQSRRLAGDGKFSTKCTEWIKKYTSCREVFLTNSCTASLEIASILAGVEAGDEVIMPSFTFVSTANAVALRGAVPVFVDIREDTMNIDEELIESAVTHKTKAIIAVHYAGVGCEMDVIMDIARRNNLIVIEDAAQGFMSDYKGKALGTIGDIGCYSFHETKNVTCGKGGALFINNDRFSKRAEIIRDVGTDRGKFLRGEVNQYGWIDLGSSYILGEIGSAYLWAQLLEAEAITENRLIAWNKYNSQLRELEEVGVIRRPKVPINCKHNGHIYYALLKNGINRDDFLERMKKNSVQSVFHYIPLHNSPAMRKLKTKYNSQRLPITEDLSSRIVRLPMWTGVEAHISDVTAVVKKSIEVD